MLIPHPTTIWDTRVCIWKIMLINQRLRILSLLLTVKYSFDRSDLVNADTMQEYGRVIKKRFDWLTEWKRQAASNLNVVENLNLPGSWRIMWFEKCLILLFLELSILIKIILICLFKKQWKTIISNIFPQFLPTTIAEQVSLFTFTNSMSNLFIVYFPSSCKYDASDPFFKDQAVLKCH